MLYHVATGIGPYLTFETEEEATAFCIAYNTDPDIKPNTGAIQLHFPEGFSNAYFH